jgi:hypothetical protein
MKDLGGMSDEWRVEIDLEDEKLGHTLGERLRSLDLDDEARKRLGDRVIVTRDGPRVFLYAGSEQQAREAERTARELVASEGLTAELSVTRWHPDEEVWKDVDVPLPHTESERKAERERHESTEERQALASGEYGWEVRVDLPSLRETLELGGRLSDEGLEVHRRWRHLLIPAPSEERAAELAERVRAEAPAGSTVEVEVAGDLPSPVFVYLGAHTPGIARDLDL